MKRKRISKRTDIPNWHDPNMPVLRYGKVNGVVGYHYIKPEDIANYYKIKLEQVGWQMPSWDVDPTYNLKAKKHKP